MDGQAGIRLTRKDWISNRTMVYFWVNMLFMADGDGVVETSLSRLAKDLGLSVREVRTCLSRILNDKRATHQATKQGTKITICDYDSYKDVRQTERQTLRHTDDKPCDTREKESPLLPPDGFPSDSSSLSPLIFPQEKEEKEGDTDVSPKKKAKPFSGPSDLSFVLDLWNSSAKRSIPKVRIITPARREKVKLRIKEMGGEEKSRETLAECFKKISESDFCNGATGKWVATFDWFFENEKNWLKVLEGNYDNRKEKTQLEQLAELYQKGHEHYGRQYGYGGASAYGDPAGGRQDGPDEQ